MSPVLRWLQLGRMKEKHFAGEVGGSSLVSTSPAVVWWISLVVEGNSVCGWIVFFLFLFCFFWLIGWFSP